ncbi:MAG: hypothetical protein RBU37_15550 [Myxococcota bacterium]|jgi:hypothetical protein|nr:hypothetical protein [Myxococcota bacterium]
MLWPLALIPACGAAHGYGTPQGIRIERLIPADGDGQPGVLALHVDAQGCYEMSLWQQRARGCLDSVLFADFKAELEQRWLELAMAGESEPALEVSRDRVRFELAQGRVVSVDEPSLRGLQSWSQALVVAVEKRNQLPEEGAPSASGWTGFELYHRQAEHGSTFFSLSTSGRWRCGFEDGDRYEVLVGAMDEAQAQRAVAVLLEGIGSDELVLVNRRERAPDLDLRAWNLGYSGRLLRPDLARAVLEWLEQEGWTDVCRGNAELAGERNLEED